MAESELKGKVLVMDDEDMVGEIACQMLKHLGYGAKHVRDGREAVDEYVRKFNAGDSYSVVILDLTIPGGMGGKEAVTEILAVDSAARVLVSSGYSTDPIMTNYHEYGFAGVINKPFDLVTIQQALDAID